jgi:hypothetical protein
MLMADALHGAGSSLNVEVSSETDAKRPKFVPVFLPFGALLAQSSGVDSFPCLTRLYFDKPLDLGLGGRLRIITDSRAIYR